MFRSIARALTTAAVVGAVAFAPSVAQAAPAVPSPSPTLAPACFPFPTPQARLVDVRFARHATFDRLVFDFRCDVPEVEARFVRVVRDDGSGRRLFVPGRAFLLLRFEPARARNLPRGVQFTPELRNVEGFRLAGDFEGVVHVAVGLNSRRPVRVFTLPGNRVVLDVFRTSRF